MTLSIAHPADIALQAWRGFRGHARQREIDVAGFIREKRHAAHGRRRVSDRTNAADDRRWHTVRDLFAEERCDVLGRTFHGST